MAAVAGRHFAATETALLCREGRADNQASCEFFNHLALTAFKWLLIMKPLSQQVRDLVAAQPTSAYGIARQAGIDKATMSRFMNGGTLTMEKLDRLAIVLGVAITSHVSLVPRPLAKGRPPSKDSQRESMDTKTAKRWADHYAEDAFKNHFSSRRGVWLIEDLDCLLIYNNNPFKIPNIRTQELHLIQGELDKLQIKTLAHGEGGEKLINSDGLYTATLLLDCSSDRMNEVVSIVQDAAHWASQKIEEVTR